MLARKPCCERKIPATLSLRYPFARFIQARRGHLSYICPSKYQQILSGGMRNKHRSYYCPPSLLAYFYLSSMHVEIQLSCRVSLMRFECFTNLVNLWYLRSILEQPHLEDRAGRDEIETLKRSCKITFARQEANTTRRCSNSNFRPSS